MQSRIFGGVLVIALLAGRPAAATLPACLTAFSAFEASAPEVRAAAATHCANVCRATSREAGLTEKAYKNVVHRLGTCARAVPRRAPRPSAADAVMDAVARAQELDTDPGASFADKAAAWDAVAAIRVRGGNKMARHASGQASAWRRLDALAKEMRASWAEIRWSLGRDLATVEEKQARVGAFLRTYAELRQSLEYVEATRAIAELAAGNAFPLAPSATPARGDATAGPGAAPATVVRDGRPAPRPRYARTAVLLGGLFRATPVGVGGSARAGVYFGGANEVFIDAGGYTFDTLGCDVPSIMVLLGATHAFGEPGTLRPYVGGGIGVILAGDPPIDCGDVFPVDSYPIAALVGVRYEVAEWFGLYAEAELGFIINGSVPVVLAASLGLQFDIPLE